MWMQDDLEQRRISRQVQNKEGVTILLLLFLMKSHHKTNLAACHRLRLWNLRQATCATTTRWEYDQGSRDDEDKRISATSSSLYYAQ